MFMVRAYHRNWGLCNLRSDARLVGMSNDYTLDDTTGLPVVPEGYFWRVKYDKGHSDEPWDHLVVELRQTIAPKWYKKNRSRKVGHTYNRIHNIYLRYTHDGMFNSDELPQLVLNMSQEVLRKHAEPIEFEANLVKLEKMGKSLTGDYPPKTLKDN